MPKLPPDVKVPRGSGSAPRVCDSCQETGTLSENWLESPIIIQNEELLCQAPRMVCSSCGMSYATTDQADRAFEIGVAAYQKGHRLLTAAEIKDERIRRGWTQEELANFAHVGKASIKRWERGRRVQTSANDQALRHAFSKEPSPDWVKVSLDTKSRLPDCAWESDNYWFTDITITQSVETDVEKYTLGITDAAAERYNPVAA